MDTSIIKLRYQGTCRSCGATVEKSTMAEWNRDEKCITCLSCVAHRGQVKEISPAGDPTSNGQVPANTASPEPLPPPPFDVGTAGGAARREFERRQTKREQVFDEKFKRLSPIVKFLSDSPQSTKAWKRGAEGEEEMAASFTRRLGNQAIVLHDRMIPNSRANIDHLVIAPSGIWVVDAKHYQGRLQKRTIGLGSRRRNELLVGGRNKTSLAEGVIKQVDLVRAQLDDDISVRGVLCFVRAEWDFLSSPFHVNGILVTYGRALAKTILKTSDLDTARMYALATELSAKFPAYKK